MAQFARPIADLDNTGVWTTEPLWSDIEEGGGGDGTVVVSDSSPVVTEPFTVDLATITDPAVSTGHILRIRWAKNATGGGNKTIRIELREGYVNESTLGTLIATDDYSINSLTLRTDATTMSAGEADTISDYADLQIRVMGVASNRQLQVDYVELETPDAVTFVDGTADGRAAPSGLAVGEPIRIGTTSGRAVPSGEAVADVIRIGTTDGRAVPSGQAATDLIHHGTADGSAVPTGQAVGAAISAAVDGAAQGHAVPSGQAQADLIIPAIAQGHGIPSGQVIGVVIGATVTATAAGHAVPSGSATGTRLISGAVFGQAVITGQGAATMLIPATANGHAATFGVAAADLIHSVTTQGHAIPSGQGIGGIAGVAATQWFTRMTRRSRPPPWT